MKRVLFILLALAVAAGSSHSEPRSARAVAVGLCADQLSCQRQCGSSHRPDETS